MTKKEIFDLLADYDDDTEVGCFIEGLGDDEFYSFEGVLDHEDLDSIPKNEAYLQGRRTG